MKQLFLLFRKHLLLPLFQRLLLFRKSLLLPLFQRLLLFRKSLLLPLFQQLLLFRKHLLSALFQRSLLFRKHLPALKIPLLPKHNRLNPLMFQRHNLPCSQALQPDTLFQQPYKPLCFLRSLQTLFLQILFRHVSANIVPAGTAAASTIMEKAAASRRFKWILFF